MSVSPGRLRIVVVGQTPPPIHGQTTMIRTLLGGQYDGVDLFHVPTRFSRTAVEVGRGRLRKLVELLAVIWRLRRVRRSQGTEVLYYVPAPPALVPVLRDLLLLNVARPWFERVVFHFHAGGVAAYETRLPAPLRVLFRRAYRRPDVAILTSPDAPDDGHALDAYDTWVIPNGIADPRPSGIGSAPPRRAAPPRVLYLGIVSEAKGVRTLLEACRTLCARDLDFGIDIAGPCTDEGLQRELDRASASGLLAGRLKLHGVVDGEAKWTLFRRASLFCFPSMHPSETFGLVMIEAMAYSLPVVASNRRGAKRIVVDGETGLLFPPGDAGALARRLEELLRAPARRIALGAEGRACYEREFTVEQFRAEMQRVFDYLRKGAV